MWLEHPLEHFTALRRFGIGDPYAGDREQRLRVPVGVTVADAQRRLLIAETAGAPIGMVRFDALPGRASEHELSINVRPDARGASVGAAILSAACGYFGTQLGPGRIRASVRLSNDTSRKLFERAGFIRAATKADDDFLSYVLDVAAPPRVAGRDS